MTSFTLDTYCIIDVDEARPDAVHVMRLAAAHASGEASVAVVAMMASERQKGGRRVENFTEFEARLKNLGLGHLELTLPLMYLDICFWDKSLFAGPEDTVLEKALHQILPDVSFEYADYCASKRLEPKTTTLDSVARWQNARCDLQAIWSHIHRGTEVFVTSDGKFHRKREALIRLGAGEILTPAGAVRRI